MTRDLRNFRSFQLKFRFYFPLLIFQVQIISAQQIEQFWCLGNYKLFESAKKQLADPLFSSYSAWNSTYLGGGFSLLESQTSYTYRFWISCQALCLPKIAGRYFSSLLFNQIMAHDSIGFELFIYLCLDWQTPQEIFHWVFCLCRLKALKMVSCLDVISCYLLRGIYSKTNRNRKLN